MEKLEVALLCSRLVILQYDVQLLARNSFFWRGTQSYCFGEQDGLVDERWNLSPAKFQYADQNISEF